MTAKTIRDDGWVVIHVCHLRLCPEVSNERCHSQSQSMSNQFPSRETGACCLAGGPSWAGRAPAKQAGLPDMKDYEKELAAKFMTLSTTEVNALERDLHVQSATATDIHNKDYVPNSADVPDRPFTPRVWADIQAEIQKIPAKKRASYDQAAFLAPSYAHNPEFVARFWDCQVYGNATEAAKAAAEQLVGHFRMKEHWFGVDALGRDICQDLDFTESERAFLWQGGCQPLSSADRFGRPVLMVWPLLHYRSRIQAQAKRLWYLLQDFANRHSPIAQKLGCTVVYYFLGDKTLSPMAFLELVSQGGMETVKLFPVRFNAYHACYDDVSLRPIMYFVPKISDWSVRLRFRAHFGSDTECRYELERYGIPTHVMPPPDEYDETNLAPIKDHYRCQFLPERYKREQEEVVANLSGMAHPKDVLLGRGRRTQAHPGNALLNQLVQERYEDYKECVGYGERREVFQHVLDAILASGGRFLKRSEDEAIGRDWVAVSEKEAFEKVAVTFRSQTKMKKRKEGVEDNGTAPKHGIVAFSKDAPVQSLKKQKTFQPQSSAFETMSGHVVTPPLNPLPVGDLRNSVSPDSLTLLTGADTAIDQMLLTMKDEDPFFDSNHVNDVLSLVDELDSKAETDDDVMDALVGCVW